jgi:hypothetical protein
MKRVHAIVLGLTLALGVLGAGVVVVGWEHHDVRAVACYDRPDQPC